MHVMNKCMTSASFGREVLVMGCTGRAELLGVGVKSDGLARTCLNGFIGLLDTPQITDGINISFVIGSHCEWKRTTVEMQLWNFAPSRTLVARWNMTPRFVFTFPPSLHL